ncbi:hypothetical protein J6590_005804 [Homalodisca vitripennis]|nr:hypothetical protein J6590_005804 [Homalodisca vitripennis]
MSHRKCFRDAAHNATPSPLPLITTHSRSRSQLKRPKELRNSKTAATEICTLIDLSHGIWSQSPSEEKKKLAVKKLKTDSFHVHQRLLDYKMK